MSLALKPNHASVKAYYETLHEHGQLHFDHEGAVRRAFADLLAKCGKKSRLTLVTEYPIERLRIRVDGALISPDNLVHGLWEAKDEDDDLQKEAKQKLEKGYPSENILFQSPKRIILYQSRVRVRDEDISDPQKLVDVVNQFFDYKAPHIKEWEDAVEEFSVRIPELAAAVKKTIDDERKRNPSFIQAFDDFYALCRQAINPNLSEEAVERMLIQHLLTERIFRKIFNNAEFRTRNVVAAEIEKVITELTKRAFNRDEFLRGLYRFYKAIEHSAENTTGFSEKQAFLNKVYERFFQGYSPKEADTHGIVYTPQPIVNFMVRSVEEILQKEFGRSLSDKGVHILDPFVGTGNFIVRIMEEIKTTALPYKYENELHCNEVMLLPYYIASMNIEHAYFDRAGEYKAFPGICLVDTFELAEGEQSGFSFMNAENAERVKRQKESPIFVIIGNPPYNAGQVDENDNNKNRKYPIIDKRVSETFGKDSNATLLRKLQDPYLKAMRWATDRIGFEGIVCFVTNSSFIDDRSLDGVRSALGWYFDQVYVLDLGGNVRKNPKLSGTTHNVFGIQVGVSISLFIRKTGGVKDLCCPIRYASVDQFWRKEQKYDFLNSVSSAQGVEWKLLTPDKNNTWITHDLRSEFSDYLPLAGGSQESSIFAADALGISTNRDAVTYAFQTSQLRETILKFIDAYNLEVIRYEDAGRPKNVDEFLSKSTIKWSETLKLKLQRGVRCKFDPSKFRDVLYRPLTTELLYYDDVLIDRPSSFNRTFPSNVNENLSLSVTGPGSDKPFMAMAAGLPVDLHLVGPGCGTQCFPFYTYAEDGTNRHENITDWALEQFRARYGDGSITKWGIFHYIYAVLHHPEYRQRYAANLRRELPRIPFVAASTSTLSSRAKQDGSLANNPAESRDPVSAGVQHGRREESSQRASSGQVRSTNASQSQGKTQARTGSFDSAQDDKIGVVADLDIFRAFVKAGQRLAEIHVHYEQQPEYPLIKKEKAGEKLDYRVEKMKLSKDKSTLTYNQFLTLSGIPKETYEYRLGNRSALEWVIDQYQVSTDKRSGITNDPNREDDPTYILRLIGQVITVSLETVKILQGLPPLGVEAVASDTSEG
jgi:predicted helicase